MPRRQIDALPALSSVLILAAAGFYAASRCVSSGDLWVALGCGDWILASGVARTDPFSFTSVPGTWVNQNWLSHVLFSTLRSLGGLPLLGAWKIAVCITIGAFTAATARKLGASLPLAVLAAVAMAIVGRSFHDLRPNLHTTAMSAALLYWLAGSGRRSLSRSGAVLGFMVPWVNLHGGFLFGILACAATAAGHIISRAAGRSITAGRGILLLPAAAVAAGVLSPFGFENLTHPYAVTFGPDARHWRTVIEWMPPWGTSAAGDPGVRAFRILVAVGALVAIVAFIASIRSRGRPRTAVPDPRGDAHEPADLIPPALVSLAAFLLALNSRRFIPIFAVASLPVLAAAADRRLAGGIRMPRRIAWPAAAVLAVALAAFDSAPRLFRPNDLWTGSVGWAERLVRADEQPWDALRHLADSGARGRLLNPWTWGGAVIDAIPIEGKEPRVKIFIDGRAQAAYPASASQDLEALEAAAETGEQAAVEAFLRHYAIDLCLVDRRQPAMARAMSGLPHWAVIYADDRSLLLARDEIAHGLRAGAYPSQAIEDLTAAIRTPDPNTAFALALRSLDRGPTSIALAEATRIALAASGLEGTEARRRAAGACDRILRSPVPGISTVELLTLRANASQCRYFLARSEEDRETAARMREQASRYAEEATRLAERYLR